ncbi:hypothetical protein EZS27_022067 [termite gut metagenome]|jgi:hypothetical protein|uniref:Uncharacterized protein n=1 Tax=termite gut metagenome TaxID=433724 RepID=A0A5J4R8S7_9ZZZZ
MLCGKFSPLEEEVKFGSSEVGFGKVHTYLHGIKDKVRCKYRKNKSPIYI